MKPTLLHTARLSAIALSIAVLTACGGGGGSAPNTNKDPGSTSGKTDQTNASQTGGTNAGNATGGSGSTGGTGANTGNTAGSGNQAGSGNMAGSGNNTTAPATGGNNGANAGTASGNTGSAGTNTGNTGANTGNTGSAGTNTGNTAGGNTAGSSNNTTAPATGGNNGANAGTASGNTGANTGNTAGNGNQAGSGSTAGGSNPPAAPTVEATYTYHSADFSSSYSGRNNDSITEKLFTVQRLSDGTFTYTEGGTTPYSNSDIYTFQTFGQHPKDDKMPAAVMVCNKQSNKAVAFLVNDSAKLLTVAEAEPLLLNKQLTNEGANCATSPAAAPATDSSHIDHVKSRLAKAQRIGNTYLLQRYYAISYGSGSATRTALLDFSESAYPTPDVLTLFTGDDSKAVVQPPANPPANPPAAGGGSNSGSQPANPPATGGGSNSGSQPANPPAAGGGSNNGSQPANPPAAGGGSNSGSQPANPPATGGGSNSGSQPAEAKEFKNIYRFYYSFQSSDRGVNASIQDKGSATVRGDAISYAYEDTVKKTTHTYDATTHVLKPFAPLGQHPNHPELPAAVMVCTTGKWGVPVGFFFPKGSSGFASDERMTTLLKDSQQLEPAMLTCADPGDTEAIDLSKRGVKEDVIRGAQQGGYNNYQLGKHRYYGIAVKQAGSTDRVKVVLRYNYNTSNGDNGLAMFLVK